ncbi:flap endonuclease GEN homolog 1 [Spea bombifrons]|uniref:flap endonuclease GEN homolog 1 n=1 Tax=Spea bombifrons TaxID=233779 RepID=UPI00234B0EBB|nr:flap endonuclease GEN homolog 1 [Spea bombifrons]
MGVHELWSILEPVKKHVPLHSLAGKTLAVDLSLWVCEAQTVKKMVGVVTKPHLRNLFFRVSSLSLMGVKLVFVTEGEAPKIKADTMNKRNEMRYGSSNKPASARPGRSYFKSVLKECLQLLECLGVPWVQAAGEAEAMCAYLDAKGYVDGCITNDGDVFLYGAQTVYRNFTMNVKDPHVDCYEASSIKSKLGLDRDSMVGLAVFLGCDYLPKGVPGVGKEQALKLIETLKGESLLQRFYQWKKQFNDPTIPSTSAKKVAHCSVCCHPGSAKDHERSGCALCGSNRYCEPHDYDYRCPCNWHRTEQEKRANPVEYSIKMKAKKCEGFPFHEVIEEFIRNKNKLVKVIKWVRPNLLSFQNFALDRMEWPKHYACEKLLALLTHYDMNERKAGREPAARLQAIRIVKTRVKNGIPCFEIEWVKPDEYVFADDHPSDSPLVTIEEESLFQAAYPQTVALYQKEKMEEEEKKHKSKKSKSKSKVIPDLDDVAALLSEMSLKPALEKPPASNSNLECGGTQSSKEENVHTWDLAAKTETFLQPATELEIFTADNVDESEEDVTGTCYSPAQCGTPPSDASSPNISSLISELQLSSIDWDSTSFSKSPKAETHTAGVGCPNSEPKKEESCNDKQTDDNPKTISQDDNEVVRQLIGPKVASKENKLKSCSTEDSKVEYQRLSLKERILLKNACRSGVPYPQNLDSKSLPEKLRPISGHKKESNSGNSVTVDESAKENNQIPKVKTESVKWGPEENKKHPVTAVKAVACAGVSVKPLELPATKQNGSVQDPNKIPLIPVKKPYTFVKDPKKIPLLPTRTLSVSSVSNKIVSQTAPKITTKKSVCRKLGSSSEDETEETMGRMDNVCRVEPRAKNHSRLKSNKSKKESGFINHKNISPASNVVVLGYSLKDLPLSPEHKSPGAGDRSDDSIVSVDSPLPLSERLKLRSLQNC